MFNRKNIIAVPLIILLFVSCYFVYNYIGIFTLNLNNMMLFFSSLLGVLISAIAISVHFSEDGQVLLLNDLAKHIESMYTSAHSIPKNRMMKDKRAYEYIKSNFNSLSQQESKLRVEYEALKAFKNSFSYEIRTPMNAIFGYTKLLKETVLNKEQKDLISIIETSYKKLNARLNDISLESEKQQPILEVKEMPFNIVKEVETAVETFSVEADEKDIVLGLYIDPQIPHNLLGDGEKLSQVLTHLIDNALAVSDSYSTIDIKLENIVADDRVNIKFSISDQGVGVESEELEYIQKVFQEMEIVDTSATLDIKNLTISNRIIKLMGGGLEVESKINEGSSFSFKVSFTKDNEEVDIKLNPVFKGLKIGLALPHKDIKRQVDYNLQTYVEYLGGTFVIYSYDEINGNDKTELPDVMFMYHSYAKNMGELDSFSDLNCKIILITSGSLRSQIDLEKHYLSSVVYAPITMSKILRILSESNENILPSYRNNEVNKNVHVLVVEDNVISQTIIANILTNMNITVSVASNGKEAYALRKENEYDIIFMDINMPIMNGFDATTKIMSYEKENNYKHIPIIAFSTDTTRRDKKKYLNAGMVDLIGKPVHAEDIQNIVQKYCSKILTKSSK